MTKLMTLVVLATALWAQRPDVNGNWTGEIHPGGATLHFAVHLEGSGGTWESVDQHATVPVKSVDMKDRLVTVNGGIFTFDGALDAAGQQITGTFHQGPAQFPLTLRKIAGALPHATRPQDPVRPLPYSEAEVTLAGAGGVQLAGTLTFPKQGGPFAAVLLLSGSGAQDRDEALMGHRPFLVLSDYLTRLGFAVLRLDDRGTGKSGGVFERTTYADKAADAKAAIAFLKTRKEVDPARLGLIGHSEGASIAPMAAGDLKDVAFAVLLAGMGVPGTDLLRQQGIDTIRAAGGTEEQVKRQAEMQGKLFAIFRNAKTRAEAEQQTRELLGPAAEAQIAAMESATFHDLLAFDPGPILRKLSCSVLALNGSKDTQVSARHNLTAIAAALAESSSKDWTVAELAGLNHLFQTANTGGIQEYSMIEETISPQALRTVGDWLAARFLTRK